MGEHDAYAEAARPAPRGHITIGSGGSSGGDFFAALEAATVRSGARIQRHILATRLVLDAQGTVLGVEALQLPAGGVSRRHARYIRLFNKGKGILYGPPAQALSRKLEKLERKGVRRLIRARRGVIVATGGFIHNREMVARYLPHHRNAVPMGSAGCTGAGIQIAEAAGADTARMEIADTSRTLLVPKTFARAMLVNAHGERFIAEDAYGATIGQEILARQGRKAWLIVDAALFRLSWRAIMPWVPMLVRYRLRAFMPLAFAWKRAGSLADLARKCGMDVTLLNASVVAYNRAVAVGADPLGKLAANLRAVGRGPYYAINCAIDSMGFPPTSFTLGGLAVDEDTGQVLDKSGAAIHGLYAAGRAAVGLPSNFYVSGLSIADCVFSGRRAGTAAAENAVDEAASSANPIRQRV